MYCRLSRSLSPSFAGKVNRINLPPVVDTIQPTPHFLAEQNCLAIKTTRKKDINNSQGMKRKFLFEILANPAAITHGIAIFGIHQGQFLRKISISSRRAHQKDCNHELQCRSVCSWLRTLSGPEAAVKQERNE